MAVLGWKAGPEQYGPNELLEQAVAAEKAGFKSLNVSDHFHPWSEEGRRASRGRGWGRRRCGPKRSALGTGLTCPILRYHPAVIAQAAATLAVMAPGQDVPVRGDGGGAERVFVGGGVAGL